MVPSCSFLSACVLYKVNVSMCIKLVISFLRWGGGVPHSNVQMWGVATFRGSGQLPLLIGLQLSEKLQLLLRFPLLPPQLFPQHLSTAVHLLSVCLLSLDLALPAAARST